MSTRRLALALITSSLAFGSAGGLRAQDDDPLRGGTFEFGAVVGRGSFQSKSGLESCTWFGVRLGHRFAPFSGNDRLQLGIRTGLEGCATDHVEDGRIDVIHLNVTILLGLRLGRSWMVYWGNGIGELLGDSTPGAGREVEPRFGGHTGLGVIRALGRRFFLDASLTGIIFENFDRGEAPEGGSTLGLVPSLMLALQI